MNVSKTPIPLDDEETIKRFTEEMHRRSFPLPSQDYSTQVIRPPVSSHNSGQETDNPDQVKDQSTQTNPITITINIYPSGQKPPHLKGPAADNLAIDHSKLKNPALESVIAQSPQVSGVLAPPSTPEIPNHEIAQMIANAIDDLPPEVFSSLGDSRFAPRRSVSPRKSPGNIASSVSKDHVYSSLNKQLSPVERKAKEESFTRMSFKAADTDPTLVDDKLLKSAFINDVQNSKWADKPPKRTPPAPISIGTAHARTNPFSVLSDSVDMKADSVVFSNVRSNADGAEEAAATKENVTVETSIPPHLRPVAKSSRASVSTDAEFVQLADKLELSDSTYGQDDTKVANKEPSKQPASAEPEISGSNLHSMFHLPGPRAPLPIKAPKVATLQSASPMRSAFENPTSSSVSPSTQDMSALTPSSVEFKTASPPKTASGVTNDENLQGALFFKAWPKLEDRKKPAAQIRKVMITGIPSPNPRLIASLVFGGALDHFYTRETSAVVVFIRAEDAQKYYDATPNGVEYKRDGKICNAFVEIGEDVDVVSGQLATYIEKGFTRCVRAIGVAPNMSLSQLWARAEDKNRKVEWIEDGKSPSGLRSIVFRFCNIRCAVNFKLSLEREEEWDHCNIQFHTDPCEIATGPHY